MTTTADPIVAGCPGAALNQVDEVLIRFNPLPADGPLGVGDPATATLLDDLARADEVERGAAQTVSDHLYTLVPTAAPAARRDLLALRRAVHRGVVPAAETIAATSGAPLRDWLDAVHRRTAGQGRLAEHAASRLAAERAQLWTLLGDPALGRSVVLAGRGGADGLARYRSVPVARHRRRERRAESGVLRYTLRALLKVSPFAEFTVVAREGAGGAQPAVSRRRVEPDLLPIRRLVTAAARRPELLPDVPVRAAFALRRQGPEVVWWPDVDDFAAPHAVGADADTARTARCTPALRAVLDHLDVAPERRCRAADLIDLLAPAVGRAPATGYLATLVRTGVLSVDPPVRDQAADPLAEAARWLDTLAGVLPAELAAQLRSMRADYAELARVVEGEPIRVRSALDRVGRRWQAAFARLDLAAPASPGAFVDAAVQDPVGLPADGRAAAVRDLREVLGALRVLEDTVPLRRVATLRLVAEHGRGATVDAGALASAMPQTYRQCWSLVYGDADTEDPVLRRILADRHGFVEAVAAALHAADPHAVQVALPIAAVRAAHRAAAAVDPVSYAAFVQPVRTGPDRQRLVLNHVYDGFGHYRSRFLPLLGAPEAAALRRRLRAAAAPGTVLLQVRPALGFTGNRHPLVADADLDFGSGAAPGGCSIDDVVVRHDPDTDDIAVRLRDGRPARIHYHGFLVPFSLPDRCSMFYALQGSTDLSADLVDLVDRAGRRDGERYYPRLVHGEVILGRRRWYLPGESLPRPAADDADADLLVRVHRWRRDRGIPSRVFVRDLPPRPDPSSAEGGWQAALAMRPKPVPLDLTSPLQLRCLLPKLAAPPGREVLVEEELPHPDESPLVGGEGRHACELMIEFDRIDRAGWTR